MSTMESLGNARQMSSIASFILTQLDEGSVTVLVYGSKEITPRCADRFTRFALGVMVNTSTRSAGTINECAEDF